MVTVAVWVSRETSYDLTPARVLVEKGTQGGIETHRPVS